MTQTTGNSTQSRVIFCTLTRLSEIIKNITFRHVTGTKLIVPYSCLQDNGDLPSTSLKEGHSSQIHTAIMDFSTLELRLLGYLQQDWESHYSLSSDHDEISFIKFRSLGLDEEPEARPELDIAVHVKKEEGQVVVAIHSPYWMVNKTGRLLQYKADDIHRKHPKDYDMPLLFSFKPRNFLQNNKVWENVIERALNIQLFC